MAQLSLFSDCMNRMLMNAAGVPKAEKGKQGSTRHKLVGLHAFTCAGARAEASCSGRRRPTRMPRWCRSYSRMCMYSALAKFRSSRTDLGCRGLYRQLISYTAASDPNDVGDSLSLSLSLSPSPSLSLYVSRHSRLNGTQCSKSLWQDIGPAVQHNVPTTWGS